MDTTPTLGAGMRWGGGGRKWWADTLAGGGGGGGRGLEFVGGGGGRREGGGEDPVEVLDLLESNPETNGTGAPPPMPTTCDIDVA